MAARLHILGHPSLPLRIDLHPEDSQLFNCWNFCQAAEAMGLDYAFYGLAGSVLPPGRRGRLVELGQATGRWSFRNHWHQVYSQRLNRALAQEIADDGKPEWVASLYGVAHCDVEAPAGVPVLEPMPGYGTCWTHYRVFPSYAQQSVIYTSQPESKQDRYFDTVIPHFVNPDDYEVSEHPGDYLLYLGREAPDKGVSIAKEVAEKAGRPFRCVFRGCAGEAKKRLLAEAQAVLMPTLYLEPFGYVAIEALLSGTPAITTDWGSFPEIIENGVNGFRCRTAAEFAAAVEGVARLDRRAIREAALRKYTVAAVAPAFRRYLDFIWTAHHDGGYYAAGARR